VSADTDKLIARWNELFLEPEVRRVGDALASALKQAQAELRAVRGPVTAGRVSDRVLLEQAEADLARAREALDAAQEFIAETHRTYGRGLPEEWRAEARAILDARAALAAGSDT
jgi:hypothetical protein